MELNGLAVIIIYLTQEHLRGREPISLAVVCKQTKITRSTLLRYLAEGESIGLLIVDSSVEARPTVKLTAVGLAIGKELISSDNL